MSDKYRLEKTEKSDRKMRSTPIAELQFQFYYKNIRKIHRGWEVEDAGQKGKKDGQTVCFRYRHYVFQFFDKELGREFFSDIEYKLEWYVF